MKTVFCFLIVLASICLPLTVRAENLYTGDRLYEFGKGIPTQYKYFVQLMGGESSKAATVRYECVRKTHPSLAVGVFEVPVSRGARPRLPFTVAVASYVTKEEADEVLQVTRQRFDYRAVAKCLGIADADTLRAVDLFKHDTFAIELKVGQQNWKHSIVRSPIAPYNGIGDIRNRSDDTARQALIERTPYDNAQAVSAALASYRGRYPRLHFAVIQHGALYFVSVTSIVGDAGLKAGIQAMREVGAYQLAVTASFKPVETDLVMQNSVSLVDIEGITLPTLQATTKTGNRLSTLVLESADLFESLPARVKRCYEGKIFKDASQLRELASCSGVVLTPSALTRCLLDSDCQGPRVPIGFAIPEVKLVATCLEASVRQSGFLAEKNSLDPVTACQATTLDPTFLAIIDKSGLGACFVDGGINSNECLKAKNIISSLCSEPVNAQLCANAGEAVKETKWRVDAVLACLNEGKCGMVVPRPPAVEVLVAREAERLGLTLDENLTVTKEALGTLGADTAKVVSKFKECTALKDSGKKDEAATCFVKLGLNQDELDLLTCVSNANNEAAKALCFAPAGTAAGDAVLKAQCAYDAGTDIAALATCAGGDASKVTEAYKCASTSESVGDAALHCLGSLPPDIVAGIDCVKTKQSASGYLQCLPNLGGKEKAALCLANAQTEAERLGCISTNLAIDPKLATALGCISTSDGNGVAMAACAASPLLPPEVAKAAACAANSTGATDFALCAAGSGLNPELRIAAECAVSTGGAPPAFAACSAGRLTVRELGKCLSGEIGKEGGCFGPNNDLVKAFNTQINDVLYGPGENNDLRVALGKITEPLKSLGGEVSHGLQRVADDAKRGDVGRTICNWFGC